jgi:hypothetical protein
MPPHYGLARHDPTRYRDIALGGTAKALADQSATSAVVAAIAPICVDQFQRSADVAANLTELKKASTWEQSTYVEKGGWALMPGSKTVSIRECRKPALTCSAN